MITNHFSNNNIGIQLKTDKISQGKDLLKGNTIVGENKVSMEYEYEHEVVSRHTRKNRKRYHISKQKNLHSYDIPRQSNIVACLRTNLCR